MAQNSARYNWTREEVDNKLKTIMADIWNASSKTAADLGHAGDYQLGANAAGFMKVFFHFDKNFHITIIVYLSRT